MTVKYARGEMDANFMELVARMSGIESPQEATEAMSKGSFLSNKVLEPAQGNICVLIGVATTVMANVVMNASERIGEEHRADLAEMMIDEIGVMVKDACEKLRRGEEIQLN